MKILMINVVCGIRSTGRICTDMADKLTTEGHEVKIAYGRELVPEKYQKYAVKIGNNLDQRLHGIRTRVLDEHGFGSKKATKKFLKWADDYNPDMVWLHNIHGYYINVEMLFDWIKKRSDMQVKWTLHDCWAFTGHCSHFSVIGCELWKEQCMNCVQKRRYPASFIKDNCRKNYMRKRAAFTGVANMTIITPSIWLAKLVKVSFLKEYPVEVCYNAIDVEVFKKTPSDFRKKYGLENKKIVLGVASTWDDRKGLDDFIKLAQMLDEQYMIVLVGLNNSQIRNLPANIIGLRRTNNSKELAEIYTAADVFVNPSKEETFGLTTVEALACGTRAIVYKGTACEEIVEKYDEGIAAENSVQAIYKEICKCQKE